MELIPAAGLCLASKNVLSGAGWIRWLVREQSKAPQDNGWRVFSHIDTTAYLHDASNLEIVDYNRMCELEPALIGVWDFPVGSDLQIVVEEAGTRVVETATGRVIPPEEFFLPPQFRG